MYILSGLIGGSLGFGMSIIIRLELALPGFLICSSLQYNSSITLSVFEWKDVIMTKKEDSL